MPVELQIAVGLVALLGFGLSLFLGWLKYKEWRAEPDLQLDMNWIVGGGGPSTLLIVAENRGDARGGVRHIVLSPTEVHDPSTAFAYLAHYAKLPVTLDPGAFEGFPIELDPNATRHTFTRQLLAGTLTHAILIDQDRHKRAFPIPAQPPEVTNRISLVGRVVKA